jgi:hypothetical protein
MLVALIFAFFVGGLLGSIAMALACAAHDREEFRRVDARRPVADGRYVEVELPRRQPPRPRAAWAGGKQ